MALCRQESFREWSELELSAEQFSTEESKRSPGKEVQNRE